MFTQDEFKKLDSLVEGFSKRAKHASIWSYNEFINEWYKFIEEVEKGYSPLMTIDDYTNDLTKRDLIEELLQKTLSQLREKILKEIEPWDVRFKKATNKLTNPLLGKNPDWWWYRLPKKLRGELEKDVKSLKIS